mgnify:CR=1 FL=1
MRSNSVHVEFLWRHLAQESKKIHLGLGDGEIKAVFSLFVLWSEPIVNEGGADIAGFFFRAFGKDEDADSCGGFFVWHDEFEMLH